MHVTGHTSFDGQTAPSPGRRGPVAIRDVAQAAGVSYPPVSTVINGRPNVKGETRGRVEGAVRALGFWRNATTFALAGGVSRAVTVVTSKDTGRKKSAHAPAEPTLVHRGSAGPRGS
ncbi:LacI family DNA-binding transcriptional regulator [Streptomyces canus]|uniref:LacI family DNA-binding transcriptional regulator n=1 Tax=Streptomyces canus TaxID=58343 RepID=UPI00386769D1